MNRSGSSRSTAHGSPDPNDAQATALDLAFDAAVSRRRLVHIDPHLRAHSRTHDRPLATS
jgi:hypothetical protein